jgi:carbamoyltransferase
MPKEFQQKHTVLGLWDGHDAGAALVIEGQLVAAISEERLTRVKRQGGFPTQSVREVLKLHGLESKDVDYVSVAGTQGRLPARILNQQYTDMDPDSVDPLSAASKAFSAYQNHVASMPGIKQVETIATKNILRKRLKELDLDHCALNLVDHHTAHAATAAAALAPSEAAALIVTMDGYGDGCSSTVWRYENNSLEKIQTAGPRSSVALLYGALTRDLGFKEGEEGKVTGLAASAAPDIAQRLNLKRFLHHLQGRIQVRHRAALRTLRRAQESGTNAADLAGSLQWAMEEVVCEFIQTKLREHGCTRLAVAGGLFANVSLNGRLAQLDLDEFVVFPAMTDQGLCAGAAFITSGLHHPHAAPHMQLGTAISGRGPDPYEVATLISAGRFVGLARGSMEFGPRALGCRSILFDPRRPDLAEALQHMLGRSPFMPFAPIMNAQRWNEVFDVSRKGLERVTREMTLALPTRTGFKEIAPAAVHVDGTARPQAVELLDDPWMVEVLEHFNARTGCPALINTSFNMHREPIVCTEADALKSAEAIELDALVVGDELIDVTSPHIEPQHGRV